LAVMDALGNLMKGRTSVVIAHHLSTIRHADVIFVVNDCALAEQGTHDELMARNGVYAELARIQTSAEAPVDADLKGQALQPLPLQALLVQAVNEPIGNVPAKAAGAKRVAPLTIGQSRQ
jgi:hypothetical protein